MWILVSNAGIDQPPGVPVETHRIEDIALEADRRVPEVNVLGLILAT